MGMPAIMPATRGPSTRPTMVSPHSNSGTRMILSSRATPRTVARWETLRYKRIVEEKMPLTQSQFEMVKQLVLRVGKGLRDTKVTGIREKAPLDVVSDLDVWAESQVVAFLKENFPNDSILSEESANQVDYAERLWVLDPLDGTVNRMGDVPFYAVSLALLVNGIPSVGLIYDPVREELFGAIRGQGATFNGRPMAVEEEGLRGIAFTTGALNALRNVPAQQLSVVFGTLGKMRNFGAQALHLAYVAAGRLCGAVAVETRLWDNAAGALLVTEAGGCYSDIAGANPFPLGAGDPTLSGGASSCIAGCRRVHPELCKLLAQG